MSDDQRTDRGRERVYLLLIMVAAVAIRLAGLHHESYTMDEITEIRISQTPVRDIVVRADGFPPLYHLTLKSWLSAWNHADMARGWSALLSLLTILGVYLFGSEIGGRKAGLCAAGIVAISPLHVWFAQEARAYALTLPLAALALWLFVRALRTNRLMDWLAYAGVALAGLYTHYYFSLLVTLNGLWMLASLPRLRPLGRAVVAHGLLFLLALPLLLLLRGDLALQSGTLLSPFSVGDFFYTFYAFLLGFSTGLSLRELHGTHLSVALPIFLPWVLALGACLTLLAPELKRSFRDDKRSLVYLMLMVLGPVLLCASLSFFLHVKYKVSYVLIAAIPMAVLLGRAVATGWGHRTTRIAVALYAVLAAASLSNRHLVARYQNEDLRGLTAYLTARSTPDVPVLVISGYMADPLRYYLGPDWSVQGLSKDPNAAAPQFALAAHSPGAFWFVYTRPFHGDPGGWVRDYIAENGRIHLEASFAGIDLYRGDGSQTHRHEEAS